ncbi:MAG: hypothetical protein MUP66_00700 [Candidatus Nanohaloarchaeota archaeon QJJ-5]|nr:hypothetical protein [Candidatus Nanohaloarchaeota archaeon QJJ-5]
MSLDTRIDSLHDDVDSLITTIEEHDIRTTDAEKRVAEQKESLNRLKERLTDQNGDIETKEITDPS